MFVRLQTTSAAEASGYARQKHLSLQPFMAQRARWWEDSEEDAEAKPYAAVSTVGSELQD